MALLITNHLQTRQRQWNSCHGQGQLCKKMENILSNPSQFQKVLNGYSITNLANFQQFLYYFKKNSFLGKYIYDRIRPTSAVTPTLYGQPKLHKKGYPSRPILVSNGGYAYECAS